MATADKAGRLIELLVGGRSYGRQELLTLVGNLSQLGGTRHYNLAAGRAKGTAAVDFDTGSGLYFTVLPDRGLDISAATYKGINLVYRTPNGEVHPAFYHPHGSEWLRTFFGGLLTTCGLTYFGAPGYDGDETLGLHGRYSATPAVQVRDISCWCEDDYRLELRGAVEECSLFGDRIRLTRTISADLGGRCLQIHDVAENFGFRNSPLTILYHINCGFPLLDAGSELVLSSIECDPYDEVSRVEQDHFDRFTAPVPGFQEQNFLHRMAVDGEGYAYAAILNRKLLGGLGLYIKFLSASLPYLSEWKMLGEGEYVVGLEPCNVRCANRAVLRQRGILPSLSPGETREMRLEIGILEGIEEIKAFVKRTRGITAGTGHPIQENG